MRGAPKSRTSVIWGIQWSVSTVEKDGESGGRFRTVRHEHLLGLVGRSHFPAQLQAEESEERRLLDWDRGNTIFTSSAKSKAESLRAAGRSFIYNRKSNGPMTEPWGTPLRQEASSERTPSIWSWYDRFDKNDLIQFSTAPSMPESFSLSSRNRWLTESNAFAKSRLTKSTVCPSSNKRVTRSSRRIRLDKQGRRGRNPSWLGERDRVLVKNKSRAFLSILSNILHSQGGSWPRPPGPHF